MKGRITLIPIGGLANRMRVIASAAKMTQEQGGDLSVIWNINDWLGCGSRELFTLKGISVRDRNDRGTTHLVNRLESRTYFLRGIKYYGNESIYKNTVGLTEEEYRRNLTGIMAHEGDMCFETDAGFYWGRDWSIFSWAPDITERAEEVARSCGGRGNYISMHIRRTDHKGAIENSPDSVFLEKLEEIFALDGSSRVYLATDDPELEKTIRDRFGEDRILTCGNKVLDRGDSSGIKAAAVDLLCLSMGREIYGS
ncbi:MAG: hypothetical protein K6E33_06825, partial [Lachnospiraceae bacterium]|nr:hypothetical protein [Lachnospiraceae bacterium]